MTAVSQKKPASKPLLISTLQGEVTARVPFWFMRQAGRYLPEYRELRKQAGSFLNLCFTPEMAAEVTLQPIRRFDMDAAILFSDILVIPYALGQQLDFVEGEGPKLGTFLPDTLKLDANKLIPVYAALERSRSQLSPDKALIGFAGGPWTLACYMIQGHGNGKFEKAKEFAQQNPEDFNALIQLLTETIAWYLSEKVKHGADAVQIFDSWAGLLPGPEFSRWVIAPTRRIVDHLRREHPGIPVIGFPRSAGNLYVRYASETGVQGLGVDQHMPIRQVLDDVGEKTCLQGNLDPEHLLKGGTEMQSAAEKILGAARDKPFVFNLGHGIIKETPPEHVMALSRIVRDFRRW